MNSSFFSTNRQRLLGALGNDALVILAGFTAMQWHGDSAVPFRQEANFWYLTGIEYADWRLIIDGRQGKTWLVAPFVDATHQLFDGSLSPEGAKSISGVDTVIDSERGERLLDALAKQYSSVFTVGVPSYAEHAGFVLNPAAENLRRGLNRRFDEVKDCQKELSRLRAIKQPDELVMMRRAAEVSVGAFEAVRDNLEKYRYEYEVEAELINHFRKHNATHAFEPIVAGGKNACTLHYVANGDELSRGQLLLIDAGARYDSYPADVTRAYAVGESSQRQVAVHAAVQAAERQVVESIRPGLTIRSYLENTDRIMKEALISLGLMKDSHDEKAYRRYFPHAISHGLGLDVHESLGGFKELRPGMVLTIEPGIYITEESIGVRIEDAVLVTETGYESLTTALSTDL